MTPSTIVRRMVYPSYWGWAVGWLGCGIWWPLWRPNVSGLSVGELGLPHLSSTQSQRSTSFVSTLPTVLMWCMGLVMWRIWLVDWWLGRRE
jgi:hypothetical protein